MASAAPMSMTSPLTRLTTAETLRFTKPQPITFDRTWSVRSIASLALMSGVSSFLLFLLVTSLPPAPGWVWAPFLFTIFGSTLGMLLEMHLLQRGVPFQQSHSRMTRWVRRVRLLNLAPVTATIFYFVCAMVIGDPELRFVMLCLAGALGTGLGFALYYGGAEQAVQVLMPTLQLAQVVLALGLGARAGGGFVTLLLVAQAIVQTAALLTTTRDPRLSTKFHVLSTLSGVLLYAAASIAAADDPGFAGRVATETPDGAFATLAFLGACLSGLLFVARKFPLTYGNWRAQASHHLWSSVYYLLLSQKRFPNPIPLGEVYRGGPPPPISLKPYYLVHPQHLVENLSIPAGESLTSSVRAFAKLLQQIKTVFTVLSRLDNAFPHADAGKPLAQKPRLELSSDGDGYWPRLFERELFGLTVPGPHTAVAPNSAIDAYREGQLLAYLCESGIGSTLIDFAADHGSDFRVADFRHLERYPTKADYESYGGLAYFEVDATTRRLRLVSVVLPQTTREILVNPADPVFRRAEAIVIASLYFQIISGKHLAEIHMTYNLVEVAMHNAFDATGGFNHPLRTLLYLHFFSHMLAEELTTEHLVQQRAVFSQIFATTHTALIQHLNDCYHRFRYGEDEEFDRRRELFTVRNGRGGPGDLLPYAGITWELEYAAIWKRYADAAVDAIYADDAAVCADRQLQSFHTELNAVLLNGLPERYDRFGTKRGVATFLSDTIHHCVIRHEVYGTSGVLAALDPRISQTQVARDGGPPGVEEWRSLVCIGLATSRARFTPLQADYTYLLAGVASEYRAALENAFEQLQRDLKALQNRWESTDHDRTLNAEYFRPLPRDLDTGPGY